MSTAIQTLHDLVHEPVSVVPDDKASMVQSLIEQYRRLGQEADKIEESRVAIRNIIIGLYEAGTTDLLIGDKVVATYTPVTRHNLNTEALKAAFPESEYPHFYNVSTVYSLRIPRRTEAG